MNIVCLLSGHKPDFTRQPDYLYDVAVCSRCNKHLYRHTNWLGHTWYVDKYWDVKEDKK